MPTARGISLNLCGQAGVHFLHHVLFIHLLPANWVFSSLIAFHRLAWGKQLRAIRTIFVLMLGIVIVFLGHCVVQSLRETTSLASRMAAEAAAEAAGQSVGWSIGDHIARYLAHSNARGASASKAGTSVSQLLIDLMRPEVVKYAFKR